ncbi:cytochrome P450 [Artomyces pyxidatus]|uniref:Cytochrome P450 n=1 Tax=Artomyces pyxidatus TaxID=48021 RepID=A0ACB8SI21_9AGAM|nr:cytochrome P450 [Artomyces pyxidatus]
MTISTRVFLDSTLSFFVLAGLVIILVIRHIQSPYRKVPPGPRGLPILGNLRELTDTVWLASSSHKEEYGEIVYLQVPGQSVIVLNSQRVAADLLDRRTSIYSDRPPMIMASDIYAGGLELPLTRTGDLWRRMSRTAHEGLKSTDQLHLVKAKEAAICALDMLANCSEWDAHLTRFAESLMTSTLYGTAPLRAGPSADKERVKKIHDHATTLQVILMPGSDWLQVVPWMKHIPARFARWKRTGLQWFARESQLFESLMQTVRDDVSKGIDSPTVGAALIASQSRWGLSDLETDWVAGSLHIAGADTLHSSMVWWLLAMVAYPDVQRRAQAELDAVVGRNRLPAFSDLPNLPYICAMVKETLRWRPVPRLGVPHYSNADDWYNGMFIPKGTVCLVNMMQCNLDPAVYGEDAARFDPARHLDADGQIERGPPDTKDEGHITFGFGKRACIGRHVAKDATFIAMATMLWAMDISRGKDEHGQDLPLDLQGHAYNAAVQRPRPFICSVEPRFSEVEEILAELRDLRV